MKELYAALAAAQGEFQPIAKNRTVRMNSKRTGSVITFRFADLEEIISKTRPALSKHGLSVIQLIQPDDEEDGMVLETIITHAAGDSLKSSFPIPSPGTFDDPKSMGAYISYIRRYALGAALGVAADDDLDDAEVEDAPTKPAKSQPRRRQEEASGEAEQKPDQPADKAEGKKASSGEINWLKKKLETRADAAELLKKVGAASVDDITADQFAALKTAVLS